MSMCRALFFNSPMGKGPIQSVVHKREIITQRHASRQNLDQSDLNSASIGTCFTILGWW